MSTKNEKLILGSLVLAPTIIKHVSNAIRDTVKEPAIGSVVYCDLVAGTSEHSGIYLGNGKIMHLNGKGWIQAVSPDEFIENTTALSIYVGCRGKSPVGDLVVAERAIQYEKEIGVKDYHVLFNNCHQFTSSCLSGDTKNSTSFLWFLKDECKKYLNVDTWRVWEDPTINEKQKNNSYTKNDLISVEKQIQEKNKLLEELDELEIPLLKEMVKHAGKNPGMSRMFWPGWEARNEKWRSKADENESRMEALTRQIDNAKSELCQLEELKNEIENYLYGEK